MNYIIYHANCMDGLCAAWVTRKALRERGVSDSDMKIISAHYQTPVPNHDYQPEDNVYIVDFSYPREELKALALKCHVTVLDHHDTAEQQLASLDMEVPGNFVFNQELSGAGLAWTWFFGDQQMPFIVSRVQDRDLWQFHYHDTIPFSLSLQDHNRKHDLDFWEAMHAPKDWKVIGNFPSPLVENMIEKGMVLHENLQHQLETFIAKKKYKIIRWHDFDVALFNTPTLISELGEYAYKKLDVDFSMSYFINADGRVIFSLRAPSYGVHVGEVARKHGGGGHAASAGFSLDSIKGMKFLSDLYLS